jgi:mono/diheme cytochrome c family protein
MNYPVWEVTFGSQWVIAFIAVVHVFIAHFAIGGGLFLVAVETRAHRHDDHQLLAWLRGHTQFFLLLTVVFGALTGVGIWFTIGLISPEATSNLIHVFVWAWAVEWVLFLVEIMAILVYAYTWDTLPKPTHRAVGWVYFAAAWLSLAVINGILSFMLTPGSWLKTQKIWDGFFNPGYFPSLAIRTLICVILAGVYALFTSAFLKDRVLRAEISRYASYWVWMPAILLGPAVFWYLHTVPQAHRDLLHLNSYIRGFVLAMVSASALLVLLAFAVAWLKPTWVTRPLAVLLMVLAFGAFGATEWIREDLRKPFIISGYCWANQIPVRQEATIRKAGLLASAIYVTDPAVTPQNKLHAGKELFRITCGPCHRPRHGYNALKPKLAGMDQAFVASLVMKSDMLRGGMPPFLGAPEEADAVAAYLAKDGLPQAVEPSGESAFRRRCGVCHDVRGTLRPIAEAFQGQSPADIAETIASIDLMSDKMPKWTGTEAERQAIGTFLSQACSAGGKTT